MKMTVLDENYNLTVEQDVLLEVARAFGTPPKIGYWANMREGCLTASVRLAFREEGLKETPRTVVLMGTPS
jgi:hypothetical protein